METIKEMTKKYLSSGGVYFDLRGANQHVRKSLLIVNKIAESYESAVQKHIPLVYVSKPSLPEGFMDILEYYNDLRS